MEKWASKWLEMHSQRHRFFKKFWGSPPPPDPPRAIGGSTPSPILPRSRRKPLGSSVRLSVPPPPPPPVINPSGSSPVDGLILPPGNKAILHAFPLSKNDFFIAFAYNMRAIISCL